MGHDNTHIVRAAMHHEGEQKRYGDERSTIYLALYVLEDANNDCGSVYLVYLKKEPGPDFIRPSWRKHWEPCAPQKRTLRELMQSFDRRRHPIKKFMWDARFVIYRSYRFLTLSQLG